MNNNLAYLRELTEQLPDLSAMIKEGGGKVIEYDVVGTCIGFCLHKEAGVAVQRVFMSKGTTFNEHVHDESEVMTVYKGKLVFDCKKGFVEVEAGQSISFVPGEYHSAEAAQDTWLIATTVPADPGYPDGSK